MMWLSIRKTTPFFQYIPTRILLNLSLHELCIPQGEVARLRMELEQELNHFVVSYDRDVFLKYTLLQKHICANFRGAQLRDEQIKTLQTYEQKVQKYKVSFVIYQKPLEIIDPQSSPMAEFFHSGAAVSPD